MFAIKPSMFAFNNINDNLGKQLLLFSSLKQDWCRCLIKIAAAICSWANPSIAFCLPLSGLLSMYLPLFLISSKREPSRC